MKEGINNDKISCLYFRLQTRKLSQLHRQHFLVRIFFPFFGLATLFQFKTEPAFRLEIHLSSKISNIATILPFFGWAFVSSPLCFITMVGGDSSPTSSLVVVFPHLCHTSSYILLVFPHLPMKSFQYWEISLYSKRTKILVLFALL